MNMVPSALRTWFVIHFVADLIFALPMFVAPHWTMALLGWQTIDPITTRLVAAALFGIGIESWLGRNAAVETFRAMLQLKILWSSTATLGIAWSIAEGAPAMAWLFLAVFGGFCAVWSYWRWRLTAS